MILRKSRLCPTPKNRIFLLTLIFIENLNKADFFNEPHTYTYTCDILYVCTSCASKLNKSDTIPDVISHRNETKENLCSKL